MNQSGPPFPLPPGLTHLDEGLREHLTALSGPDPDAAAIVGATLTVWHGFTVKLEPVIGARGVEALWSRSLQKAAQAFPWLPPVLEPERKGPGPLLEARDPVEVTEACVGLLTLFVELLASLIGNALSGQLLNAIWIRPRTAPQQEPKP